MMIPNIAVAALALAAAPLAVAQNPYPITGVPIPPENNGAAPMRLNINTLQANGGPMWDLYIRANRAMQARDVNNPLGWFQIEGASLLTRTKQEALFVSWHRPYVLLYEQALVMNAKRIALQYPQSVRAQYVAAANRLRAPYWDWASNPTVPPATVPERVTIMIPDGNRNRVVPRAVRNPLTNYKVPDAARQFDGFQNLQQTTRCPSPQRYPESANTLLARRPYRSWIYDLFTRGTTFSEFAVSGGNIVSLELIHNGVHWDGACGQQFLSPDLSAFDPLFMLHHTNIDRFWSYWQAIHPTQGIFTNSYSGQSRWATPGGTTINSASALQPFYMANGSPHTTQTVRNIRNFGYTYEGLEYWRMSPAQLTQSATTLINRMYGPTTGPTRGQTRGQGIARRAEKQNIERFFVHITAERGDLQRPCEIEISVDGKVCGSVVVMKAPAAGPLEAALALDRVVAPVETANLAGNTTRDVVSNGMTIRIWNPDGSLQQLPKSLNATLENVLITPAVQKDQFPKFGARKMSKVKNIKVNTNFQVNYQNMKNVQGSVKSHLKTVMQSSQTVKAYKQMEISY
ncbi:hypothetical protein RJ55_00957 [Drechmeria coniospora]|nr:hypothetical protein RJ55_00957 [Drechmeria coniospora]